MDKSDENKYLSTASWGKTEETYETKLLLLASIIKKSISGKDFKIVDAGAGLGRNSIYLSKKGFKVIAIEYDKGAIAPLEENIRENNQSENISVIKQNILDYLKLQEDHSIDALLDNGMSHYLKPEEKEQYFSLLKQKLSTDGLFSITHFSKEDMSAYGLTEKELKSFISGMTELVKIHPDSFIDSISHSEHFAHKGLLIMPSSNSDIIKKKFEKICEMIRNNDITSIEQIYTYLQESLKVSTQR